MIENFDFFEEDVDVDLTINDESPFALSNELKNHARREAKYVRMSSKANKAVADLDLELRIITSTVVQEICDEAINNGKPIPPSAVSDLRKVKVPLDLRYQKICRRLNEAMEEANYLNGLVSAWISRGYRLQELTKLSDRLLQNDLRILGDGQPREQVKSKVKRMEDLLDEELDK
jgi:hypothetical protein